MQKIKVFTSASPETLENDINDFLSNLKENQLINISGNAGEYCLFSIVRYDDGKYKN